MLGRETYIIAGSRRRVPDTDTSNEMTCQARLQLFICIRGGTVFSFFLYQILFPSRVAGLIFNPLKMGVFLRLACFMRNARELREAAGALEMLPWRLACGHFAETHFFLGFSLSLPSWSLNF